MLSLAIFHNLLIFMNFFRKRNACVRPVTIILYEPAAKPGISITLPILHKPSSRRVNYQGFPLEEPVSYTG